MRKKYLFSIFVTALLFIAMAYATRTNDYSQDFQKISPLFQDSLKDSINALEGNMTPASYGCLLVAGETEEPTVCDDTISCITCVQPTACEDNTCLSGWTCVPVYCTTLWLTCKLTCEVGLTCYPSCGGITCYTSCPTGCATTCPTYCFTECFTQCCNLSD
jgi:hypothetical protein